MFFFFFFNAHRGVQFGIILKVLENPFASPDPFPRGVQVCAQPQSRWKMIDRSTEESQYKVKSAGYSFPMKFVLSTGKIFCS